MDPQAAYENWRDATDEYERAPDSPEFCDALCDAAEYLGWAEGEYSYEALREAVEAS